jgi:hypothetical protein
MLDIAAILLYLHMDHCCGVLTGLRGYNTTIRYVKNLKTISTIDL